MKNDIGIRLGVFSLLLVFILLILLTVPVSPADQVFTTENSGYKNPVSDTVLFPSEKSLDKVIEKRKCYVSRPFGYMECMENDQVNLTIVRTYIDRVSKDKAYIRGEIRNQDDKTIDLIVITFNLFNANGEQIGNAYASIDYLEPKRTWKFSTEPILGSEFRFERFGSIFTGVFR